MSKQVAKLPTPGRIVRGTSRAGMGGGAILIGLAMFLLCRGFGPGGTGSSGSGTGSSPGDIVKSSMPEGERPDIPEPDLIAADPLIGGLTDDERKALSSDILTVLIDDYQYMIQLPGTSDAMFRPATLPRIVELATLAKGDSNGTKVRVLIRQTARASAEKQLQADLEHGGIHRDAIMMTSEFVP